MEIPSIPRSVPVEASGSGTPLDIHTTVSAGMPPRSPASGSMSEFGRGGRMDRDMLMDDLDLILERRRDDELPGERDWEPPLGTGGPVAIAAAEPRGDRGDRHRGIERGSERLGGRARRARRRSRRRSRERRRRRRRGRLNFPQEGGGRRQAPSWPFVRRPGPTGRGPGPEPPPARSHRHPRTRRRRPTWRRTTDPAASGRRGRTPASGS